jgi:hypothetical protein
MESAGLTERQQSAARRIAAGWSERHTATVEGVCRATIQNWKKLPDFQAEIERARAARLDPTPRGTLLEAIYGARKDDGVDWPTRVRAAIELMRLDRESGGDDVLGDDEPGWQTV